MCGIATSDECSATPPPRSEFRHDGNKRGRAPSCCHDSLSSGDSRKCQPRHCATNASNTYSGDGPNFAAADVACDIMNVLWLACTGSAADKGTISSPATPQGKTEIMTGPRLRSTTNAKWHYLVPWAATLAAAVPWIVDTPWAVDPPWVVDTPWATAMVCR